MEDLDETIIAELKEKAIERPVDATEEDDNILIEEPEPEPEPEPVKEVKKSKKVRSEKQKAAFEKARKTRAENLKIKKLLDAEKKEQKKKEKEIVKAQVKERLDNPQYPVLQSPSLEHRAEAQRQVVNNYYYYGNPDTWHSEWEQEFGQGPTPPKRKKKVQPSRRPPTPSSESETDSEVSEVDEPPSYRDLQEYDEDASRGPSSPAPAQPKFKFRFA